YGGAFLGQQVIFAITVYSEEEWSALNEEPGSSTQIELDSVAGRVYVLTLPETASSADEAALRAVQEGFRVLNE
ncbi:MAG: hypothetical protein ACI4GO_08500, partial [Hominenteromicrobium sp.]